MEAVANQARRSGAVPTVEEINSFVMPRVSPGSRVLFYRSGQYDRNIETVGTVIHVGRRGVSVTLPNGTFLEAVRHLNDPKLMLNPEQRESGCWQFTREHVEFQELKARVISLEKALGVFVSQSGHEPKSDKMLLEMDGGEQYRYLKSVASQYGIEVSGNPKKSDLIKSFSESLKCENNESEVIAVLAARDSGDPLSLGSDPFGD